MRQEAVNGTGDLEQLGRRFEGFRSAQTSRGRLPESLWKEAAEMARRYGVNPTAQALRLDYNRLKKRMLAAPDGVQRKTNRSPVPAFLELIGPGPTATTECQVEVESSGGAKLRLELKGVAASELGLLIRAFLGQ